MYVQRDVPTRPAWRSSPHVAGAWLELIADTGASMASGRVVVVERLLGDAAR